MTQVGASVFPGYEGAIFWAGAGFAAFAVIGLLILLFWPRSEAKERAGGITVKMGNQNKVGGIGNKYDGRER